MQSLILPVKSDNSVIASTKRTDQSFSNAAKRLNKTTAETSASLNVEFASAKFTPPPPQVLALN
ncbi:MAG: hypothetical protein LBO72_08940 [Helicobacteraceae bacterium]|jgi:hypothetical protein|nr:hypothetical protein [Helicobacteraceae bacterium]